MRHRRDPLDRSPRPSPTRGRRLARPARGDPARALHRWARLLAVAWLGVAAPVASHAAGFVALDLAQRLEAAHDAAVGTVVVVDVEVRDGEPWTVVTLEVERWWRRGGEAVQADALGVDDATTLTAAFWGGRAPGVERLQVAGMPAFVIGERVIWWLRRADEGLAAATVGVTQGVWRDLSGSWRGDDGSTLGVDESGDLRLGGDSVPDALLFAAITAAFGPVEGAP